jgi:flagellar assembly factor FliW
MKLHTKFEDIVEINESEILQFKQGIPGFEVEKQFVLIPMEGTPFSILQSVATSKLAFITVDPFVFFKEYDLELPVSVQEQLQIRQSSEVVVQVIVTVAELFGDSTANLKAPIIINKQQNIGKQVVLTDSNYQTRHLLTESNPAGQEG